MLDKSRARAESVVDLTLSQRKNCDLDRDNARHWLAPLIGHVCQLVCTYVFSTVGRYLCGELCALASSSVVIKLDSSF